MIAARTFDSGMTAAWLIAERPPTLATATENRSKNVAQIHTLESEPTIAGTAAATEATTHGSPGTGLVITGTFLLVADNVVGAGDFLEPFLCSVIAWIRIRVVLTGELAVRLGDISLSRVLGDTKDGVVVGLEPLTLDVICHRC